MNLIYSYDAYCGWCFGFKLVMHKIYETYKDLLYIDVLSGGMILPEKPVHISASATYIAKEYKNVEALSGVKFGTDYLWHILNPDESDWFPNSEKPSIALAIIREKYPERSLEFAEDMQIALFEEGRDLTDNEAYRHLLSKYNFEAEDFYEALKSETYKAKAYEDFEFAKQLKVSGYPTLLLQADASKFYLLSRGYTSFEQLKATIDKVLHEIEGNK